MELYRAASLHLCVVILCVCVCVYGLYSLEREGKSAAAGLQDMRRITNKRNAVSV